MKPISPLNDKYSKNAKSQFLEKDLRLKLLEEEITSIKTFKEKISSIYISEFEEKIDNILIVKESEFMYQFSSRVKLLLEDLYSEEAYENQTFSLVVKDADKKFYEEIFKLAYKLIFKTWNLFLNNNQKKNIDNSNLLKNFRKHCGNTEYALHNCGGRFLTVIDEQKKISYVICIKCQACYFSSFILMYCEYCSEEYYSTHLTNFNKDYQPATWEKYHCGALINDAMKCIKCKEAFYIKNDGKLICVSRNCRLEIDPLLIMWNCILCKKDFKTGAKIYNPLEFKIVKISIKNALLNKKHIRSCRLPCCDINLNDAEINELKLPEFFHKIECRGILHDGEIFDKKIIVCSKCKIYTNYERFTWTCPLCFKRFKQTEQDIIDYLKLDKEKKKIINSSFMKRQNLRLSQSGQSETESIIENKNIKLEKKDSLVPVRTEENFNSNIKISSPDQSNRSRERENFQPMAYNRDNYSRGISVSGTQKENIRNISLSVNKYKGEANPIGSRQNTPLRYGRESDPDFDKNILNFSPHKILSNINSTPKPVNSNFKIVNPLRKSEKLENELSSSMNNIPSRSESRFSSRTPNKVPELITDEIRSEDLNINQNRLERRSNNKSRGTSMFHIQEEEILTSEEGLSSARETNGNNLSSKKNINNYQDIHQNLQSSGGFNQANFSDAKNNYNPLKVQSINVYNIANPTNYSNYNQSPLNNTPNLIYKKNLAISKTQNENKLQISGGMFLRTPRNQSELIIEKEEIKGRSNIPSKIVYLRKSVDKHPREIPNYNNPKINVIQSQPVQSTALNPIQNIQNLQNKKSEQLNYNNSSNKSSNSIIPEVTQVSQEPQKLREFNFEDYNIITLIGEGTFGKIYLVDDKNKNIFSLKKIIANDEVDLENFQQEYELVNQVPHKNILKILGTCHRKLDITTHALYILMEVGLSDWEKDIKSRMSYKNYYSEKELISILKQLVSALAFLQTNNIAHRDIKPQNVLIFKNEIYKVADFGEAKQIEKMETNKQLNTLRGTELYMSPLLFNALRTNQNDIKHNSYKSDVFSMGFCIFYASTLNIRALYDCRNLYDSKSIADYVLKILKSKFSFGFIKLIAKMLEINEEHRYDFLELEEVLKNFE